MGVVVMPHDQHHVHGHCARDGHDRHGHQRGRLRGHRLAQNRAWPNHQPTTRQDPPGLPRLRRGFRVEGRKIEPGFDHHTIITHGFFGHGQVVCHALDFFVQRGTPVDVVFELVGVLDVLDAKANAAEERVNSKPFINFTCPRWAAVTARHGERRGNQHGGVGGPKAQSKNFAPYSSSG